MNTMKTHFKQPKPLSAPVKIQQSSANPIHNLLPAQVEGFDTLAQVALDLRSASDYTPRLLPLHPDLATSLEANLVLWQR